MDSSITEPNTARVKGTFLAGCELRAAWGLPKLYWPSTNMVRTCTGFGSEIAYRGQPLVDGV